MNSTDLKEVEELFKSIFNNKDLLVSALKGEFNLVDFLVSDEAESPEMQFLIDNYIVLNMGGKTVVVNKNDIEEVNSWVGFLQYYSHIKEKVRVVDKKNTTEDKVAYKAIEKPVVERFLSDKAERAKKIVFKPSGQINEGEYNYFKGWPYSPVEGTKHNKFLEHIRNNICTEDVELYNYVLDWMAQIIQYPEVKEDKAIVLRGSQGIGKGVFVKQFGFLLGDAYHSLTTPGPLIGRFNSELANRLLIFADEVTWGGNKAEGARLKTFISEDRINIEFKGKDSIPMNNFARLIIASNSEWVIPVEGGDRRYVVIDVGENRKDDKAYFQSVIDDMKNGGRESLMFELLNRDISKRDWSLIPKTSARADQKLLTMEPHEQWLFDSLNGDISMEATPWGLKGPNEKIRNADIHTSYREYMNEHYPNGYLKTARELSQYFRKVFKKVAMKNNGVTYRIFDGFDTMKEMFEKYYYIDSDIWE